MIYFPNRYQLKKPLVCYFENIPLLLNKSEYGFSETKYSYYLCFQVSNRTNRFIAGNTDRYSTRQKALPDYIKSLHDSGMSYRRITKLLNKKGIKTHTGKEWGETGNSVYSVLKKYRLREERLELLNKEYELEWGTMEVKWEKL